MALPDESAVSTYPEVVAVPTCKPSVAAKLCFPVQILGLDRSRLAITAPVVGDTVSVLSEFDTEVTAPIPGIENPEIEDFAYPPK